MAGGRQDWSLRTHQYRVRQGNPNNGSLSILGGVDVCTSTRPATGGGMTRGETPAKLLGHGRREVARHRRGYGAGWMSERSWGRCCCMYVLRMYVRCGTSTEM